MGASHGCQWVEDYWGSYCFFAEDPCSGSAARNKDSCLAVKDEAGKSICTVSETCREASEFCNPDDECCLFGKDLTKGRCEAKDGCAFRENCVMQYDPCEKMGGKSQCQDDSACLWLNIPFEDGREGLCQSKMDQCQGFSGNPDECEANKICKTEKNCEQSNCAKDDQCCPKTSYAACTAGKSGCSWDFSCHAIIDECHWYGESATTCASHPSGACEWEDDGGHCYDPALQRCYEAESEAACVRLKHPVLGRSMCQSESHCADSCGQCRGCLAIVNAMDIPTSDFKWYYTWQAHQQ